MFVDIEELKKSLKDRINSETKNNESSFTINIIFENRQITYKEFNQIVDYTESIKNDFKGYELEVEGKNIENGICYELNIIVKKINSN